MRWLRRIVYRLFLPPPDDTVDLLERRELCECGRDIPISEAHLIIDVEADTESGGGWVQTAAFCPEHCPGGCDHQEEHDHAHA